MNSDQAMEPTTLSKIETAVKTQDLRADLTEAEVDAGRAEIIEGSPERSAAAPAPQAKAPTASSDDPLNPPPAEIIEDSPE